MNKKLKIGILTNSYSLPSWEFRVVKDIRDSNFADIVVLISDKPDSSIPVDRKHGLAWSLLRLIDKTDRMLFGGRVSYDLKKRVTDLLVGVPEFELKTEYEKSPENIKNKVSKELGKYNLDIILKFGNQHMNDCLPGIAKYGILYYSLDGYGNRAALNTGLLEVLASQQVTATSLFLIKDKINEPDILFNSIESTCPYSININRNIISWRNSLFMPRTVYGIYRNGENFIKRQANRFRNINTSKAGHIEYLSIIKAIKYKIHYLEIILKTIFKKIFYTDAFTWHIMFGIGNDRSSLLPDFSNFKRLTSPNGIFWADPFVIAESDYYYIFVEEFIYKADKAHLSVLKLDKAGNLLNSKRIIEKPYHMSYPFVFKLDNIYYMIPETAKNETIELYRCTDFPYEWEFEKNIMEGVSAVDSTPFFFNDKWWLFTTLDQTDNISGNSTELFLYYTDNILSDNWESHPENPIISDIRTARPGGKIFIHEGKIYRPSQDCTGRYGIGFNINEITRLTENEYNESLISREEPHWDNMLRGMHTYNSDKDITVIDVYSFRKRIFPK